MQIKKVGVIGLGMLGNAVALHLMDSGFDVVAYNKTAKKASELKERGATIATSARQVGEDSEIVIIIVKDADAVKQVSFGADGITKGEHREGKLIVADMSTIDPAESKNISEQFHRHNITKLDIPVMGGPNAAATGDLVMMVSGDKAGFEKCKGVLDAIAGKIFFLDDNSSSGVAHLIKLAMNLQITMLALALSEGITLVRGSGADPKIFLDVLNSTYFKTGTSEKKAYKMIEGRYDATFTLSNLKKDITTMTDTAKSLGIELPMISKAEEMYENAVKEGFGGMDYTGIIEYIKKINQ